MGHIRDMTLVRVRVVLDPAEEGHVSALRHAGARRHHRHRQPWGNDVTRAVKHIWKI